MSVYFLAAACFVPSNKAGSLDWLLVAKSFVAWGYILLTGWLWPAKNVGR